MHFKGSVQEPIPTKQEQSFSLTQGDISLASAGTISYPQVLQPQQGQSFSLTQEQEEHTITAVPQRWRPKQATMQPLLPLLQGVRCYTDVASPDDSTGTPRMAGLSVFILSSFHPTKQTPLNPH